MAARLRVLEQAWSDALDRAAALERRWTVLYSGGLDSSLVVSGLRERATVDLVTVGLPGSADLRAGETGARWFNLPWHGRVVSPADVQGVASKDSALLDSARPASRAVLIGLALGLEASSAASVACGQGADELFLGYAHFEGLDDAETTRRRNADLDALVGEDWPRSVELARRRSRRLVSPFLDPEFSTLVRSLPIRELRGGPRRKELLRQLGESMGLPDEIVNRPKKAFQYGSGIDRALRRRD